MPRVFISYRHTDEPRVVSILRKALSHAFGVDAVLSDHGIAPGVDFAEFMADQLDRCDILLAVVGQRWQIERLAEPADFVRIEIVTALARGIPVVPVLVRGAERPAANDLPEEIRSLASRQTYELPAPFRFVGAPRPSFLELCGHSSTALADRA